MVEQEEKQEHQGKVEKIVRYTLGMALFIPIAYLEFSMSFPFPFFYAAFATLPMLIMFYGKKRAWMYAYLLPIIFFVVAYQVRSRVDVWNGNKIVAAIERYHDERHAFPEKLDELVPVYLERIPTPWTSAWEFRYHYFKKEERYLLMYNPFGMWKCGYFRPKKEWNCGD